MKRGGERQPGGEGQGGGGGQTSGREKADQARWVCEFLSSMAPPQPVSHPPRPARPHTAPSAHLFECGLHECAQLGEDLFDLYQNLEGRAGCEWGQLEGLLPTPAPERLYWPGDAAGLRVRERRGEERKGQARSGRAAAGQEERRPPSCDPSVLCGI